MFNRFKKILASPLVKSHARHAYGLAMADSSLELVNLVEHKNQLAIDFFNRVALEPGTVVRGYIRKKDKFKAAIQNLIIDLPEKEKKHMTMVTAIPDYQVFTRLLRFTASEYDRTTIKDEINQEMSKSLPLDFTEVVIRPPEDSILNMRSEVL